MSRVSNWAKLLFVSIVIFPVSAIAEDSTAKPAPVRAPAFDNETLEKDADFASHMGMGNDVHFSAPRSFRTESFNNTHMDVEPMAADPEEHSTPEPGN